MASIPTFLTMAARGLLLSLSMLVWMGFTSFKVIDSCQQGFHIAAPVFLNPTTFPQAATTWRCVLSKATWSTSLKIPKQIKSLKWILWEVVQSPTVNLELECASQRFTLNGKMHKALCLVSYVKSAGRKNKVHRSPAFRSSRASFSMQPHFLLVCWTQESDFH